MQREDTDRGEASDAPRVSIVMPTYNAASFIGKCLAMLAVQTFDDYELIIVDDGSTDATATIVAAAEKHDGRIRLFRQENAGPGPARNAGFAHATGEYVLFLDPDDIYDPGYVSALVGRADETRAQMVIARSDRFDFDTGERVFFPWLPDADLMSECVGDASVFSGADMAKYLFQFIPGWPWDKLIRRDFLLDNGLDFPPLPYTQDAGMVFPAMALAERIAIVDGQLMAHCETRTGSVSMVRFNDPAAIARAFAYIRERMRADGIFDTFRQSFSNWLCTHCDWHLTTIAEHDLEKGRELFTLYHDTLFPDFGIFDMAADAFYDERSAFFRDTVADLDYAEAIEVLEADRIRREDERDLAFLRRERQRTLDDLESTRADLARTHAELHTARCERDEARRATDALRLQLDDIERSKAYRLGNVLAAPVRMLHSDDDAPEDTAVATEPETGEGDRLSDHIIGQPAGGGQLIVSLASYPPRIATVGPTIRSIMGQDVAPDLILLWLPRREFEEAGVELPSYLPELQKSEPRFRICWTDESVRPHNKYFWTMREYPDARVVTVDDDLRYRSTMLRSLVEAHARFPHAVIATRTHQVKLADDGTLAPYTTWGIEQTEHMMEPRFDLLATNGAGSLFPPRVLPASTFDVDTITAEALRADDLWLMMWETIARIPIVACGVPTLLYTPDTQDVALAKTNFESGGNDEHLKTLFAAHPEFERILMDELHRRSALERAMG